MPLLKSLPPASMRTTCTLHRPLQQAAHGIKLGRRTTLLVVTVPLCVYVSLWTVLYSVLGWSGHVSYSHHRRPHRTSSATGGWHISRIEPSLQSLKDMADAGPGQECIPQE